MRLAPSTTAAALMLVLALAGCSEPVDDGLRRCDGDLCVEIFRGLYTSEPCAGAPDQSCTYVNVFFVLDRGDTHVRDLKPDGVSMKINDRDVGVEGEAALTQENGLLVTLLLDRSYSITQAGATPEVRDAAKGFIDTLPDEAVVTIASFASEASVPVLLDEAGNESPTAGAYYPVATSREALARVIDEGYRPYEAQSSVAFTKLHDAVARLADLRVVDQQYQALQAVAIAFTDGADTASTLYPTSASALEHVQMVAPDMKVYAVGLGADVDEAALEILSEGRNYHAANAEQLEAAFGEVADDLGAIYQLRILVAEQEYDPRATLSIAYGGRNLSTSFDLQALGAGGGPTDDGVADEGRVDGGQTDGGPPVPEPSPTCGQGCASDADCSAGAACLSTLEGVQCLPAQCLACFEAGLTCNSWTDTCTFDSCS